MANPYAANFGDVVKHLVLCEALTRESPARYLESHGGRLDYDLASIDPGPGGVWDFIALGAEVATLRTSVYAQHISHEVGTPRRPGHYPGSIALADAMLAPGTEVIAFEHVAESAVDLREGLAERGRRATIVVADGLRGVCDLARPGDFVLLDPFDVHEREPSHGLSTAEAFAVLAARGITVVLWYAIYSPDDTNDGIEQAPMGGDAWRARLIGDSSTGGLAGCGFLGAHLAANTAPTATLLLADLAVALAPVRPGLRLEESP